MLIVVVVVFINSHMELDEATMCPIKFCVNLHISFAVLFIFFLMYIFVNDVRFLFIYCVHIFVLFCLIKCKNCLNFVHEVLKLFIQVPR